MPAVVALDKCRSRSCACSNAVSAAAANPLVIGQTFTLESKALSETRRINVYLPLAYVDLATLRLQCCICPMAALVRIFCT